ncbi:MAG: RNA 2'-phosphotransferase [bacterium]|nr:RNA 2'-phosphotransferase [bacterium]
MDNKRKQTTTKTSKFLSLVLRHHPGKIGLNPDAAGWVGVDELLDKMEASGRGITLEHLKYVVENNDKKRFAFNEDCTKIRASQGHSLKVQLDYKAEAPPEVLYHGTAQRNLPAILKKGLLKMKRHHVHLSEETETARSVGSRYGKPVVLEIDTALMARAGLEFYKSANGVWLTEHVAPAYITVPD